jgi:hypothetical protein
MHLGLRASASDHNKDHETTCKDSRVPFDVLLDVPCVVVLVIRTQYPTLKPFWLRLHHILLMQRTKCQPANRLHFACIVQHLTLAPFAGFAPTPRLAPAAMVLALGPNGHNLPYVSGDNKN